MKPARNDPCPCGSGKKYKRCHLDHDAALARERSAARTDDGEQRPPPPGPRAGPAEQMVAFMQPLIEQTDGSEEQLGKVMKLGALLWNLAIAAEDEREAHMHAIAQRATEDEAGRAAFLVTARAMVARHEAMFPWLHEKRRSAAGR